MYMLSSHSTMAENPLDNAPGQNLPWRSPQIFSDSLSEQFIRASMIPVSNYNFVSESYFKMERLLNKSIVNPEVKWTYSLTTDLLNSYKLDRHTTHFRQQH